MSAVVRTRETRGRQSLRLWLRLLGCEGLVEGAVRQRLRREFGITLPQFDVLAELDRAGRALSMSELSRELMVSNGNVTGVVDRLQRDGLVRRQPAAEDRRVQRIELTPAGRERFAVIARAHERWVTELFSGLERGEMEQLVALLRKAQASVRERLAEEGGER